MCDCLCWNKLRLWGLSRIGSQVSNGRELIFFLTMTWILRYATLKGMMKY